MRFKIDENLPKEVAVLLRGGGHDAVTIWDQKMIGEPDDTIAEVCRREERCLITMDLDFADVRRYPPEKYPGIIVFRLEKKDKPVVLNIANRLKEEFANRPLAGTLWIVEDNRIRIRHHSFGKE